MDPVYFLGLFPLIFVTLWLGVCVIIMRMSGWQSLQDQFPDQPRDELLQRMYMQSGRMDHGVNFANCLGFDVCRSGLRVKVWKLFAPFAKPIFVPWGKIEVENTKILLFSYVRLMFGRPEIGALLIRSRAARRIETASLGQFSKPTK